MNNEQPLLADLRQLPTAADACLVCTNLRYLGGKKPTFVDHIDSWFLIPLGIVRFVEVPQKSIEDSEDLLALPPGDVAEETYDPIDVEGENDLLRRMREV
ncbi:MAG: hypothetical protein QOH61_779 [Chloroflexota bacterium]|nr:hypothetical protein [Chloroflexota bacterium]